MRYRYIGDEQRTFPEHNLVVDPGDVVEVDGNPDPRWFTLLDDGEDT